MQKLTEQGIKENKLMKKLTHQSTQDTRSMMTIALISAIFLPATFIAVRPLLTKKENPGTKIMQTLFGSNFFVYNQEGNRLTVASNFWVYVVIAFGFSGIAVAFWFLWRRRRARASPEDEELEAQYDLEK